MSAERLVVRGAREHNLKNVSLDLPRNSLIVFTGLSGSGKSSLAFDTIWLLDGQSRRMAGQVVRIYVSESVKKISGPPRRNG